MLFRLSHTRYAIRLPLSVASPENSLYTLDPESQSGKYASMILDEALRLEKILSEMPEQSLHPASDPSCGGAAHLPKLT